MTTETKFGLVFDSRKRLVSYDMTKLNVQVGLPDLNQSVVKTYTNERGDTAHYGDIYVGINEEWYGRFPVAVAFDGRTIHVYDEEFILSDKHSYLSFLNCRVNHNRVPERIEVYLARPNGYS